MGREAEPRYDSIIKVQVLIINWQLLNHNIRGCFGGDWQSAIAKRYTIRYAPADNPTEASTRETGAVPRYQRY